jgi:hypothetical protein
MSRSSQQGWLAQQGRRRGRRLGTAALAYALAAAIGVFAAASAAAPGIATVVLGSSSTVPDPSCPETPCQAVGSVTGFQVSTDQTKLPFSVPRDGTIKAWTLTLAQPTDKQRSFFNSFFGTPPEARLAILRKVAGTNPPRYSLVAQGATKVLSPYLGQTVKFGSNVPVEKGDIVGVSVPTWAPMFAQGLDPANVWRASRAPGTCTNSTSIREGEALEKVGKRATFGCKYSTARLLYTATLVEGQ